MAHRLCDGRIAIFIQLRPSELIRLNAPEKTVSCLVSNLDPLRFNSIVFKICENLNRMGGKPLANRTHAFGGDDSRFYHLFHDAQARKRCGKRGGDGMWRGI